MNKTKVKTVLLNAVKTLILPVVVYFLIMLLSGGRFGTLRSINSVLRAACFNVIMAWGTMFILGAGMWDFSAGAQIYVAAGIVGTMINAFNLHPVVVILLFLVINVLMRLIVASIYTLVRVRSMVCTLALTMIFEAVSKYFFAPSVTIKNTSIIALANAPWSYVILAVAAAITVLLWSFTRFAYHVRALGAGEKVARSIGLNPAKIRFRVFIIQGIFLGFCSLIYLGQNTSVRPPVNLSSAVLVFNSLMAAFIGMALERWSNRIIGVLVGTIVMTLLSSGLISMGINSAWQVTVTGVFMALFIGYSTNQQRILNFFANQKRAKIANEKFRQEQLNAGEHAE